MDNELKPCGECGGDGFVVGSTVQPECCGNAEHGCGGSGCTGPIPEHVETQEACNCCMATGYAYPASAVSALQARVRELEAVAKRICDHYTGEDDSHDLTLKWIYRELTAALHPKEGAVE